ncbi:hypothetical protein HDU96_003780 [Phlyctochytrium bullatum]|nr:hypothetical protein HDU96_003780 [Phlyctochytrium bullatum]
MAARPPRPAPSGAGPTLGILAVPIELLPPILIHLHPNDLLAVAVANRHLRCIVPPCLDLRFARRHLSAMEKAIQSRSLIQVRVVGPEELLYGIRFNHPLLSVYMIAAIARHGLSHCVAEVLWGPKWTTTVMEARTEQLRLIRVEGVRTAVQEGFWPSRGSRNLQEDLTIACEMAAYLRSIDLLDDIRTAFSAVILDDLNAQPLRSFLEVSAVTGFVGGLRLIPNNHPILHIQGEDDSRTILGRAIASRVPAAVEFLLEMGAPVNPPQRNSNPDTSPLHYAIDKRDPEVIRVLLKNGADLAVRRQGNSPLHRLIKINNNAPALRVLLEFGADTEALNGSRNSPLHLAASQESCQSIRILINAGANVNATDEWGRSALYWASKSKDEGVAKLLLSHGARADINPVPSMFPSVLHEAVVRNNELVSLLVEAKALVNATDADGRTPLHSAFGVANIEGVMILLEGGADPNIKCRAGRTPLHMMSTVFWSAVEKRVKEPAMEPILMLMLQNGVDWNVVDAEGRTVLHLAATHNERKLLLWLLKQENVDRNVMDCNGKKWIDLAIGRGLRGWLEEQRAELALVGVDIDELVRA